MHHLSERRKHCSPGNGDQRTPLHAWVGEGLLRSDYLWIVGRTINQEKGVWEFLVGCVPIRCDILPLSC